jgi:FtsX-like permease family
MLISCGNVAILLLARALSHRKEMSVRAALGANRLRLAGQILVETSVLSLMGALLGLVVSLSVIELIKKLSLGSVYRVEYRFQEMSTGCARVPVCIYRDRRGCIVGRYFASMESIENGRWLRAKRQRQPDWYCRARKTTGAVNSGNRAGCIGMCPFDQHRVADSELSSGSEPAA